MRITMNPEGCAPDDFFTGAVLRKEVPVGGIRGGARIWIRWDDPKDEDRRRACGLSEERAERQFWWDGDGKPRLCDAGDEDHAHAIQTGSAGEDSMQPPSAKQAWTPDDFDVAAWLGSLGLQQYAVAFAENE
eukprot:gene34123-45568_t